MAREEWTEWFYAGWPCIGDWIQVDANFQCGSAIFGSRRFEGMVVSIDHGTRRMRLHNTADESQMWKARRWRRKALHDPTETRRERQWSG